MRASIYLLKHSPQIREKSTSVSLACSATQFKWSEVLLKREASLERKRLMNYNVYLWYGQSLGEKALAEEHVADI